MKVKAEASMRRAFPGGKQQIEEEARELHRLLDKRISLNHAEGLLVLRPMLQQFPVASRDKQGVTYVRTFYPSLGASDVLTAYDYVIGNLDTEKAIRSRLPDLVESLFADGEELVKFFVSMSEVAQSTEDGSCIAHLKKTTPDRWTYNLQLRDGRHMGSVLRPFKPSKEHFDAFETGCRLIADRFRIYLITEQERLVPASPPAFGRLTYATQGSFSPSDAGFIDLEPGKGAPEFAVPYPDGGELVGGGERQLPARDISCPECLHIHSVEASTRKFVCEKCGAKVVPSITIF